jgi:hypothetical protein
MRSFILAPKVKPWLIFLNLPKNPSRKPEIDGIVLPFLLWYKEI